MTRIKKIVIATAALMLTGTASVAARLTDADWDGINAAAKFVVYYRLCEPPAMFSWQSNMPAKLKKAIDTIKIIYGEAEVGSASALIEIQVSKSPENQAKWCADAKPVMERGIKTL